MVPLIAVCLDSQCKFSLDSREMTNIGWQLQNFSMLNKVMLCQLAATVHIYMTTNVEWEQRTIVNIPSPYAVHTPVVQPNVFWSRVFT